MVWFVSESAGERAEEAKECARRRRAELQAGHPVMVEDVERAVQRAEQSRDRADAAHRRADQAQIRAAQVPVGEVSTGADEPADLESAVDGMELVGWFGFYFDEQRWEWSDEVARLHGYQPGTVTPTTELVLSHKHPDDRAQVAALIDDIVHTRGALSSRHRIIDTSGRVHWVIVVGGRFFDDDGAVIGTHGFYVDVTPDERLREDIVTARVAQIADNRATIDQAKGMLMLIYDINDEVAFGVLKWLSQQHNVKLRVLAEQIRTDLQVVARGALTDQSAFDRALMTAHQRLSDDPPRQHRRTTT